MYVLHAWKSSLQILIPRNFKLFLLVTLKTIMSTFKSYLKYGWPFILIVGFGMGMFVSLNKPEFIEAFREGTISDTTYWLLAAFLLVFILAYVFSNFLVAIFARPSVDQKNCAYLRAFTWRYFMGYILLNTFFMIVYGILSTDWSQVGADMWQEQLVTTTMPGNLVQHFFVLVWYITNLFGILFYLDLGGSFSSIFKSIWFAIKMTFYNVPFVAIVAGVLLLGARIGDDYVQILSYLHIILYPLVFCFITTLYTKKVHDQARLYQGN